MCLSGTQTGPSLKSLQIMQANHVKYPKFCVYWIGPLIPTVFTANVEIIKMLLRQPGGELLLYFKYMHLHTTSFRHTKTSLL